MGALLLPGASKVALVPTVRRSRWPVASVDTRTYTRTMGFVGERKAIAAGILSLYTLLFLVNALAAPPEMGVGPLFGGLAAFYGLAFFSLVAGYFWARWFAIGVGLFGVVVGIMAIVQLGLDEQFLFFGGTHGAVSLFLWGKRMAEKFDGKKSWRERFHLDEYGTQRLGKAIIRIGMSLPFLIMYGLAPREDASSTVMMLGILTLAGLGVFGILKMRTWGILTLAASAALVAVSVASSTAFLSVGYGVGIELPETGAIVAGMLLLCTLPFASPIARYLTDRR